jgi:hypothetical protein
VEGHQSAQQVRRVFPIPHAAFIASPRAAPILYANASLCSKAGAAAWLPCTANSTWQIDPSCSWIPARVLSALHLGLTAAGLCVAVGYVVRAVRRFAYGYLCTRTDIDLLQLYGLFCTFEYP